jgi:predicted O-methyltransferase YrrM
MNAPAVGKSTCYKDVLKLLHAADPYDGFVASNGDVDLQGWGSDAPLLRQAVANIKPDLVIEVGTWKGKSAITMAGWLKSLNVPSVIVCVDTWLGSTEHITDPCSSQFRADLKPRHGYPQLYYSFLNNVVCSGHHDMIIPFPNTSENAAVVFAQLGLKADLIYVDASHEYEAALRDFRAYWPLVSERGAMICDDFISWPGVTSAIGHFVRESKIKRVVACYGKALIPKNNDLTFEV